MFGGVIAEGLDRLQAIGIDIVVWLVDLQCMPSAPLSLWDC